MPELSELDPIPGGNVSDDDLLLVYDMQNQRSYKVARSVLMGDVARENEAVSFSSVSADDATFASLTAATLLFTGGGIADVVTAQTSISLPSLAAQAVGSVPVLVPGALVGMIAMATFAGGAGAGIWHSAHVSANDEVTISLGNSSGSTVAASTRNVSIFLIRLPE